MSIDGGKWTNADRGSSLAIAKPKAAASEKRVVPYDPDAECAVLGGMMLRSEIVLDLSDSLTADDFYRPAHRATYQAILALSERGEVVDPVTVVAEMETIGYPRSDETSADVWKILVDAPGGTIGSHVSILSSLGVKRRLIEAWTVAREKCLDPTVPAEAALDEAQRLVMSLGGRRRSKAVNVAEGVHDVLNAMEQGEGKGRSTGWPSLDTAIGGLRGSRLLMLAGRPGLGKTSLVAQLALNVVRGDAAARMLFISMEMTRVQLNFRILANITGIPYKNLEENRVNQDEFLKLHKAADRILNCRFDCIEGTDLDIQDVRSEARHAAKRGGLTAVVVDYLQLMRASSRLYNENRDTQIGDISRGLKSLAMELDISVIALAQLNRQVEARQNRKPQLSDLRDSGRLEQDADQVLMLYRKPDDKDDSESIPARGPIDILVLKNRHGATDRVPMYVDLPVNRWNELDSKRGF